MEAPPELVGVMECGVGQFQRVSVSGIEWTILLLSIYLFFYTGICSDLPLLTNGMIYYSEGSPANRPVDTMATYSCVTGYTLNGGTTRTCGSDGVWSGSAPTCES